MSGPEHYRVAQTLLGNLRDEMAGAPGRLLRTAEQRAEMIAEAQVHATLALAAATIAPRALGPLESWGGQHIEVLSPDRDAWDEVTR